MKKSIVGILAHVDAGKTTLAESLLCACGVIEKAGRVDHGDAFLDNGDMERKRGITIFSKQARIRWKDVDITLLDTPGHVDFNYEVSRSLAACDGAILVVDAAQGIEAQTLANVYLALDHDLDVIPVINKIDLLKGGQAELERLVAAWHELLPKAEIIPLSAQYKFNLDYLLKRIKELLPPSPPFFEKDALTDKPARFFVTEIVREKILLTYDKEIPYACEVVVEQFKEDDKQIHIMVVINVERDSQKGILIGKGGSALKRVGMLARKDIETFFQKKVFLELYVKVEKDWRNQENKLKSFGYMPD